MAAVVVAAASLVSAGGLASATTKVIATCHYSRIHVSVGATRDHAKGYPSSTRLTPIYFTNKGPECHLLLNGPVVRAFRTYKVGTVTDTQDSVPALTTGFTAVLIPELRYQAIFEVVTLAAARMKSHACDEQTAAGFLVEGYALPAASWNYYARTLKDVCFYSGPGTQISNMGMKWVGLKQS